MKRVKVRVYLFDLCYIYRYICFGEIKLSKMLFMESWNMIYNMNLEFILIV